MGSSSAARDALDPPANASTIRATVDGHLNSVPLCLRCACTLP